MSIYMSRALMRFTTYYKKMKPCTTCAGLESIGSLSWSVLRLGCSFRLFGSELRGARLGRFGFGQLFGLRLCLGFPRVLFRG